MEDYLRVVVYSDFRRMLWLERLSVAGSRLMLHLLFLLLLQDQLLSLNLHLVIDFGLIILGLHITDLSISHLPLLLLLSLILQQSKHYQSPKHHSKHDNSHPSPS